MGLKNIVKDYIKSKNNLEKIDKYIKILSEYAGLKVIKNEIKPKKKSFFNKIEITKDDSKKMNCINEKKHVFFIDFSNYLINLKEKYKNLPEDYIEKKFKRILKLCVKKHGNIEKVLRYSKELSEILDEKESGSPDLRIGKSVL
ncbi:MAG: hypothetical protein RsTaC01_0785 [Candidatus Paraimprobicoccus trichonymphae]|uniref:Uncharacterized protein n=1 Tax=Candidatus Paraimprobicoccus trichonymphae TaxID=3033793 RepID=A0AA48I054_9FIRM|nr:MAG: hypothetical protein RsTaC01_0785 [Candidatus Paraimprobicoccus trichonymphae]